MSRVPAWDSPSSKHAAQFHRARVELQSTEGSGTTVTVTFPANPAE